MASNIPNEHLTPCVLLRGLNQQSALWGEFKQAIIDAGWAPILDRTTAWHLSRGGTATFLIDFTRDDSLGVARVLAKYQDKDGQRRMVLPTVAGGQIPSTPERHVAFGIEAVRQLLATAFDRETR